LIPMRPFTLPVQIFPPKMFCFFLCIDFDPPRFVPLQTSASPSRLKVVFGAMCTGYFPLSPRCLNSAFAGSFFFFHIFRRRLSECLSGAHWRFPVFFVNNFVPKRGHLHEGVFPTAIPFFFGPTVELSPPVPNFADCSWSAFPQLTATPSLSAVSDPPPPPIYLRLTLILVLSSSPLPPRTITHTFPSFPPPSVSPPCFLPCCGTLPCPTIQIRTFQYLMIVDFRSLFS